MTEKYSRLPQKNFIKAEYVWIDSKQMIRSKCKTFPKSIYSAADLPLWNFDGSSTDDATVSNSEVTLKPVRIFPDPFRPNDANIIVLCECLDEQLVPVKSNTRHTARKFFDSVAEHEPWFGIEQEYTIMKRDAKSVYRWPENTYPSPQGPYYCGVGIENVFGRYVAEAHYSACLFAGLKISGINAEVMPGQWEYQIGPCEGIESGDQMCVSRYILKRVAEDYGLAISLHPKPVSGEWNGSGAHCNFSTREMREENGFDFIEKAISNLKADHSSMVTHFGKDNELRLSGRNETSNIREFTFGVSDRSASVRIPYNVFKSKRGYFEDRRPASNCDPYVVTRMICESSLKGMI